ncbi:hypothetical protein GCM10008931_02330 [Oceanobacillus oncorhynchi subsp. oncorhynchi]
MSGLCFGVDMENFILVMQLYFDEHVNFLFGAFKIIQVDFLFKKCDVGEINVGMKVGEEAFDKFLEKLLYQLFRQPIMFHVICFFF